MAAVVDLSYESAMTIGLKHRTLSAAIADQLRQEILSGVHASGEQLRQDALAAAYQVSRIPVREALFQLEAEGLVRIEPHKGAVVTSVSLEEVNDVFDLRLLLEERLFRRSIPALTDGDFQRIDTLQAAFAAAIGAGDVRQWGLLNAELHGALYGGARLPRTSSTVAGLLQTSDRFTRLQLSTPAAMKRAEREHAQLIALARRRAVDDACALLVRHIETVRKDLLKLLPQRKAGKASR
jgi:DNA-binding GntR family transcriptional regulator